MEIQKEDLEDAIFYIENDANFPTALLERLKKVLASEDRG